MKTTARFHQSGNINIMTIVWAVCVALLGLIVFVPSMCHQRRTGRALGNSTQTRGIHGAMVLFAQGNNGFYPGFNGRDLTSFSTPAGWSQGAPDGRNTSHRFALLLLQNYFVGEYIISPAEVRTIWTQGTVTTANYSYALLELPQAPTMAQGSTSSATLTGRLREWSSTNNVAAPVISDRSKAIDPALITGSLWITSTTATDWRGGVAWNDNHVSFESSRVLSVTRYGAVTNTSDDLFTATGDADAFMSYGK